MLKDFKTEKIIIMSCSSEMAKSILLFRNELTSRSPITIPHEWPSYRFRSFLPLYLEFLENKDDSLHLWITADLLEKRMVGDIILYMKTEYQETGFLELYFLNEKDEKVYFKECIYLYIRFVLKQLSGKMTRIRTETLMSQTFRIHILRQIGFKLKKREDPYLIWELEPDDG